MALVIHWIFNLFVILIFARVILSFVQLDYYHPVRQTIMKLTEPILAPVRQIIPPIGGLDWSPFVVILLASLLRSLISGLL